MSPRFDPAHSHVFDAHNPVAERRTRQVMWLTLVMMVVEIVAGTGSPAVFNAELAGPLQNDQLAALERVAHYTVRFSGATLPYAIQIDLSHAPDVDHGGSGRAHVVNPRGDIKSVAWSDDGSNLRALLTPVRDGSIGAFTDFKFHVAGGVSNLASVAVQAIDVQGNPVPGVDFAVPRPRRPS